MGILLISHLICAIAATAIAVPLFVIADRRPVRSTSRIVVAFLVYVLCFAGIFGFVAPLLWSQTIKQGTNVSLADYRSAGPSLPLTATQISFYSSYSGTDAKFLIAETDLNAWAKSNQWKTMEIGFPESVSVSSLDTSEVVKSGIMIDETFASRGTGIRVIFDRQTGICYYRYSHY